MEGLKLTWWQRGVWDSEGGFYRRTLAVLEVVRSLIR